MDKLSAEGATKGAQQHFQMVSKLVKTDRFIATITSRQMEEWREAATNIPESLKREYAWHYGQDWPAAIQVS